MTAMTHMEMVLFGAYEGATMEINGHIFNDGKCVVTCPSGNLEYIKNYFASYRAFPVGSPEYQAEMKAKEQANGVWIENEAGVGTGATGSVSSNAQSPSEGAPKERSDSGYVDAEASGRETSGGANGDGYADPRISEQTEAEDGDQPKVHINERLRKVVLSLDPRNDDHWTAMGKPKLAAIEEAYEDTGLTRADINAVAPDWNRDNAAEAVVALKL